MTDVIREMEYPETPDTTPGKQRDITLSAIVRQLDSIEREQRKTEATLAKVVANQAWVNEMVQFAMQALQSMPGMGAMMSKLMRK